MQVKLTNNKGHKWITNGHVYFKGYFYLEDHYFDSNQDKDILFEFDSILEKINLLQGSFSIVSLNKNEAYIVSDIIRTYPVFYSMNPHISIFDKLEKKDIISINNESLLDFKYLGYVTGNVTLSNDIFTIGAAEIVHFDENKVSISEYFKFAPIKENGLEVDYKKIHNLHIQAIKNVINSTKGRQIIIPLSSGYDSRMILELLIQDSYSNIITYTYGKKNNPELSKSKELADKYGVKWIFIESSSSEWNKFRKSKIFKEYYEYAFDLTHVPHIQDLYAVYKLNRLNLIDNDAVFVPGHSYDMIVGSHLTQNSIQKNDIESEINSIIDIHYNLWLDNNFQKKDKKQIYKRIKQSSFRDFSQNLSLKDYFDWKERQSKFIIQSLKVYQYFNYEVRLPLWDKKIIDYWNDIDYKSRLNRIEFMKYVKEYFGHDYSLDKVTKESSIPFRLRKKLFNIKDLIKNYFGWYGIMNLKSKIIYVLFNGLNINSYLSNKEIKKMKKVIKK